MKLLSLKRKSTQKVAVLATGLVAALLVSTVGPLPATATPRASNCAGCHGSDTGAVSTVTATPSTATPLPGATYTVAIAMTANPLGGDTGYGIAAVAPTPAPVVRVTGGMAGTSQLSYTATMVAPAAPGTYSYTVYTAQGLNDPTVGLTGSKVFTITVAAAQVAVTTTTALAVSPATAVAPASATLTATVTGAGAAGSVQFLNGTTVLGTSPVAAGSATLALTGVVAGSYSYTAKFIPTSAAAFTPSTSSAVAFVVTAPVPVAVTTTTALAVSPVSAVAPASATLTATVTGAGAAGSVEFFSGLISLGTSPVADGVATTPLVGLVEGTYSYTATFIPTSAAAFTPSTSSAATFVVTAPVSTAVTTTTALAVSPVSAVAPASATLTATVTGAGAAGSVEFFAGPTSLGTSVVTAGVATKALVGLVAGGYSYTAKFIPTNAAAFTTSTSSAVAFVVTAPVPAPTASFTASTVSGTFPLTVNLTDTSTGAPTSWLWDFGNGTTSAVQSPSVTFAAAGTYTVKLIASNAIGASAPVSKTITVTAPGVPSAAKIISLSETHGEVGKWVVIRGSGFGAAGVVKFGEVNATLSYWSATAIAVKVPAGNVAGTVGVTVTPTGGTASNAVPFRVESDDDDDDESDHS